MDNVSETRSDILDLVDRVYFVDYSLHQTGSEDIAEYELRKLDYTDKNEIRLKIKQLQTQSSEVGRRVSDIILQNSQAYSQELQRVSDFKLLLEDSYQICSIARRSLFMNESIFIGPTLRLINKQMKKSHLIHMFKSVQGIKQLQRTQLRIGELIEAAEYPEAISNCFDCDAALKFYEHFKCVKDLKKRVKEHFYQIEQLLDKSVAEVCQEYQQAAYEKIVASYKLLNKMDSFIDQLNTHIISALNITASRTLIGVLMTRQPAKLDELKRKEYGELCAMLTTDDYRGCLTELCNSLWLIMKNYYQMMMWHEEYLSEAVNCELSTKFSQGLNRLWQDVQLKISICFRSMCFEHIKFDEFIEILTVNNRLIEIGQEYCNRSCDSQIMLKAAKDQTLSFFKLYHVNHLDELKMFLENETWQLCPVKSSFSIFKLHEYKFLKESRFGQTSVVAEEKTVKSRPVSATKFDLNHNIIDMLGTKKPFDLTHAAKLNRSVCLSEISNRRRASSSSYSDSDSSSSEELDNSSSDKENSQIESLSRNKNILSLLIARSKKSGQNLFRTPMLTNTTLNIMRLYGKYIQMLSIFRIISNDVIGYLMQLFYFYFYYIYMQFAQGGVGEDATSSIETIIKNIKNELFVQAKYSMVEPQTVGIKSMRNRQDYLRCIQERVVAAESLVFLAQQLENLFPLISDYMPNKSVDAYLSMLRETAKMRLPIYMHISKVAVDYSQIGESIGRINWDLDEIMSQHNPYVDALLRQVQQLIMDIESMREVLVVEKRTLNIFLEQTIRLIMKMLVDGYASIKKCSNEGRALMQLDFQQLIVKLEKICEIRPMPDKDYVEAYIKAYYLPDSSLEKWVKDHSEYSPKNVISLLNLMAQATRKTKMNIVASLEM